MAFKVKTELSRLLLNSVIATSLFYNPELMEYICGPFTLSPLDRTHLLPYVICLELIRVSLRGLLLGLKQLPFMRWLPDYIPNLLTLKYLFILVMKLVLIFEESHRKKFYLHSFLLEATVLLMAILFDCIQKDNIKEAGQLLVLQGLHRLSVVYILTQTFCPNFILHYAVFNLVVFLLAQVQSQQRQGLKKSLFVKHDVYRFLFMSWLFFGLSSVAQLLNSNFKTMVSFLLSLKFQIWSTWQYFGGRYNKTSWNLLGIVFILASTQLLFLKIPFSLELS